MNYRLFSGLALFLTGCFGQQDVEVVPEPVVEYRVQEVPGAVEYVW